MLVAKSYLAFESSRQQQQPPRGPLPIPTLLATASQLESVSYTVANDITVSGWYAPSRSGAAILFLHGQPGTRADLVAEAEAVVRAGYGALLVDLPGHGESQGQATWGTIARQAVVGGLDFLTQRCDVTPGRLGLFGFSYGSSLAAHVAPEDRRIKALVLAGIFTSAREQIEYAYGSLGPLTTWPGVWGAEWEGLDLDSLRPRDVIARVAPTPVLFVAGSDDRVVPAAMTVEVFERALQPKSLLTVPGAGHGDYAQALGDSYFEQLVSYFDRYLPTKLPRSPTATPAPCTGSGYRAR